MQRVRLIRKLAPILNGVDLSRVTVGDEFVVPEAVASMLLSEGWAVLVTPENDALTPRVSRADTGDGHE